MSKPDTTNVTDIVTPSQTSEVSNVDNTSDNFAKYISELQSLYIEMNKSKLVKLHHVNKKNINYFNKLLMKLNKIYCTYNFDNYMIRYISNHPFSSSFISFIRNNDIGYIILLCGLKKIAEFFRINKIIFYDIDNFRVSFLKETRNNTLHMNVTSIIKNTRNVELNDSNHDTSKTNIHSEVHPKELDNAKSNAIKTINRLSKGYVNKFADTHSELLRTYNSLENVSESDVSCNAKGDTSELNVDGEKYERGDEERNVRYVEGDSELSQVYTVNPDDVPFAESDNSISETIVAEVDTFITTSENDSCSGIISEDINSDILSNLN